jgi:hypothetical protein
VKARILFGVSRLATNFGRGYQDTLNAVNFSPAFHHMNNQLFVLAVMLIVGLEDRERLDVTGI